MVVMTDGVSRDNERAEADLTKAEDIVIISVGIGNNLDVPMLLAIAEDPSHYLQTEYSQLAVTLSAFVESKVPCAWCKIFFSFHSPFWGEGEVLYLICRLRVYKWQSL